MPSLLRSDILTRLSTSIHGPPVAAIRYRLSIRTIHPTSATRHTRRSRHEILHCRLYKLAVTSAKRSIQRYPYQPRRSYRKHYLSRAAKCIDSVDTRPEMDFLTQTINDTWDENDPARPKDHGYAGSEEFIRMQFEEYLLAMLSSVKYKIYMEKNAHKEKLITEVEGDPASEFSNEWVHAWMQTENFRIWNKFTDSHLFDIVDPKHPCSGGLSMEDVQRRLAQYVPSFF